MAEQAAAPKKEAFKSFPKELEQHFTDSIDREFAIIFLATFLIFFGLTYWRQSLPPREMSQEDIEKIMRKIYQVEQPKVIKKTVKSDEPKQAKARKVEDVEEVKQTAEEKAERRKQQREARAAKRAAAMQAARSRGIFAQAGAVSSGRRRGGGGKTLGGGGLGGVSASGLSGIARGTEIAKVEKLRGGGAITEGAGDIDISELSLEDIELILEGSSVEVEEVPEVRGAAASSAARSADAIQGVIRGETRVLKNCYNTQKKKDPNLRGRITVRFTINADGSVSRVQVRNAEWTNRSLGRRVEQCVRQRVSRWRFDPAEGDVTTEFPLLLT